ncbi:MAG: alpha/beta hydrolase fold domain-containing protein, partial [Gemmatimonadota bacterium]
MELDPQSNAVVTAINASGVVPFHRFHPTEARKELLKLRVERPGVPTHQMSAVSEESFSTPDGSVRVRILQPRPARAEERMGAVIYFHGGGFFAGGLDETDLLVRQIAKQADVVVFN